MGAVAINKVIATAEKLANARALEEAIKAAKANGVLSATAAAEELAKAIPDSWYFARGIALRAEDWWTPVLVRFSASFAFPEIPDTTKQCNSRGTSCHF